MRITIKVSGLVLYNQYGYKLYIYIYIWLYIFPSLPQPKEEKDNSEAATGLIQVKHILWAESAQENSAIIDFITE